MIELFSDLPEALENNFNLHLRCSYRPSISKPLLPNISSEKNLSPNNILKKEAEEGLKSRLELDLKKKMMKRLTSIGKDLVMK